MRQRITELYIPIDFSPEPMTMAELAETNCTDCRWCTILLGEFYMVHDHVWEQACQSEPKTNPAETFLCVGCLEERLGRLLTPGDFMDVKLNNPNKPQGVSSRLRKRLTRMARSLPPSGGGMSCPCGPAQMNTIKIAPAIKGQVTATSSDHRNFLTTTPLFDGARYWLEKGVPPDTFIITVWSSGSSHWSLRSTIGAAAKLTVEPNTLGKPVFRLYRDSRKPVAQAHRVRKSCRP
jgi:hypothetical protein